MARDKTLKSYGSVDPTKPPSWLTARGREFWRRVAPALAKDGTLNQATFDLVATGAQAYANYRETQDHLKKEGRVITTKSGTVKANPWTALERQSFEALCKVYRTLDIAGPAEPGDDDLDTFLEDK